MRARPAGAATEVPDEELASVAGPWSPARHAAVVELTAARPDVLAVEFVRHGTYRIEMDR